MLKPGTFETLKLLNHLQEKSENWGCESYASKDPETMRTFVYTNWNYCFPHMVSYDDVTNGEAHSKLPVA